MFSQITGGVARRRAGQGRARRDIRKFVARAARLHDLVALGSLTEQAASFLGASVPLQSRRGSLSKVHPNARSIGAARVNRPPMPWPSWASPSEAVRQ